MGQLVREFDWSTHPLGPLEAWPQSLRTAVSICLGSRHPLLLLWGPNYLRFYNDGYRPILGKNKHPQFLGRPTRECWPEVWHETQPMLDCVFKTGEPVFKENHLYILERNGYLEDCFMTFSYGPLRVEGGGIGGVLCVCNETTTRVLSERRLRTLKELADRNNLSSRVQDCCSSSVESLVSKGHDILFAQIYLLDETSRTAVLACSSGAIPENPLWSHSGELDERWPIGRILRKGQPETVAISGPSPSTRAGFMEGPRNARLLPLQVRSGSGVPSTVGVLVLGSNSRCTADQAYASFFENVADQISDDLMECWALEGRRRRAAQLQERHRAEQFRLHEIFLKVPAFIAVVRGPQHVYEMANTHYYDLVGHRELIGKTVRQAFPEFPEEYLAFLDKIYATGEAFIGSDLRVDLQRTEGAPPEERYIDLTYQPLFEPDGSISGLLAHGVDITERKLAEQERLRLLEAERRTLLELDDRREELARANTDLRETGQALLNQQELQAVVLRYLRSANQACGVLTKATTVDEVLEALLKALRNGFYANVAAVYLLASDDCELRRAAEFGLGDPPPDGLPEVIHLEDSSSSLAGVGRSGLALVGIRTNLDPVWLAEHKLVSRAVFPLQVQGDLQGLAVAFFATPLLVEAEAVLSTLFSVAAASLSNFSRSHE